MKIDIDAAARKIVITDSEAKVYRVELDYWQAIGLAARLESLARAIEPPTPHGRTYAPRWS